MANDVDTTYRFKGKIPEEFKKIEYGYSVDQFNELFGLELEQDRWYVTDIEESTDDYFGLMTWSAWVPKIEPMYKLAEKYDLELDWYSSNELPYYFYGTEESDPQYVLYYEYEDPEEWYFGNFDYFGSLESVKSFIEAFDIKEYKIIGQTDPDDWYDDEELEYWLDKDINYFIEHGFE